MKEPDFMWKPIYTVLILTFVSYLVLFYFLMMKFK